jgi:hypothetical protein
MYDGFLSKKNSNNKFCLLFFIINIGQRIRIGSILSNRLDPDPDSAKYLDPDLKHFLPYNVRTLLNVLSF